jgi:lipopolysaccharide heptosyltransferase I
MASPRILFVKLSSLGDVVHNLPAVSDVAAHMPGAHIAWAVEDAYVDLVRLHPAVSEAIPVNLRALRRNLLRPSEWARVGKARREVRSTGWDYVIDTQGLLKSATVARWAGRPIFGLDRRSARERVAARFYDVALPVSKQLHAVERNRTLVAGVFGYALADAASYGVAIPAEPLLWLSTPRYAVLLHAASRTEKRWPEERWIALARLLSERGYSPVFPGGTDEELGRASRLAHAVPNGIAAPRMSLREAAALLGNAAGVVGVDTGLTHLAVALGVPTVGIYCATRPELTGLHGGNAINVGGAGEIPGVEAVAEAVARGGG